MLVLGLMLGFSSTTVQAVSIAFVPAAQVVLGGTPVDVGLAISGLGDHTAPSLGAFDLTISFDPARLSFSTVVFDTFLGTPDTDFTLLGSNSLETSIFVDDTVAGVVRLVEVSLLFDFELEALQPASFPLATLTFAPLAPGTGLLTITRQTLGDAAGAPLHVVPEPGTFLLFGAGLIGLIGYGWRRR